jgi:uncharacterized protein YggU (UPF0235/DUF167 family)
VAQLPPCFSPHKDGWLLSLLCTPKASADRIGEVIDNGQGGFALKIGVTAVPEDGKANAAVVKLLSKRWDLPKSAFTLLRGETDRRKTMLIAGEAEIVRDKILSNF